MVDERLAVMLHAALASIRHPVEKWVLARTRR
jgi:hypothetical protein